MRSLTPRNAGLFGSTSLHAALLALTWLAVFLLVDIGIEAATKRIQLDDARLTAEAWASRLAETMPRIEEAYARRSLSDEQRAVVSQGLGDVFRIKMISLEGDLFYVSDLGRYLAESHEDYSDVARRVAAGDTVVGLEDGRDAPDRPDAYAEAYVPVYAPEGNPIGVLEVYTDQTATQETLSAGLAPLKVALLAIATGVYLVPLLAMRAAASLQRRRSRRRAEERIDPLTQILNREALEADAELLLADCATKGAPLGIVFVDVDDMTGVNERFGRAGGDTYLRKLAARLSVVVRTRDRLGRLAGDSFVVLMPGITAEALAQRAGDICAHARRPMLIGRETLQGSASVGAVEARPGAESFEEALRRAHAAALAAKADGRASASMVGADGDTTRIDIPPAA